MVEVQLAKIIIDEKRQDQVIVLKEKNGARSFPIVIGVLEASSIKMKLSGIKVPRPLTHDLLQGVIQGLDAVLEKVIIDRLESSTFHAKLFIKAKSGELKKIDARPSDSIALAVRTGSPIFVEEEVIEKAKIMKAE